MRLAAKRILWAKSNNSGQVRTPLHHDYICAEICLQMCVIPDYLLVLREKQDELIAAFKEHYAAFWPEGPLNSKSYSRIVNEMHFKRVSSMLARTKGEIVLGGQSRPNFSFEPTIIKNVEDGDSLLEQYVVSLWKHMIKYADRKSSPERYLGHFYPLSPWTLSKLPSILSLLGKD